MILQAFTSQGLNHLILGQRLRSEEKGIRQYEPGYSSTLLALLTYKRSLGIMKPMKPLLDVTIWDLCYLFTYYFRKCFFFFFPQNLARYM